MKLKLAFLLPLVALAAAFLPQAALADSLTLSLSPVKQTLTTSGGTVSFQGTLAAPSSNTGNVYLNGADLAFTALGSAGDIDPFFNNTPLFLPPGTATDLVYLFTITFDSTAMVGQYFGTFGVLGGANDGALDTLASQRFEVDIVAPAASTVTPEPSSLFLLGTGMLGMLGVRLRRA